MSIKIMLNRLFKLDKTDKEVARLKKQTTREIKSAIKNMAQEGELHQKVVEKTTAFYISQAVRGGN